MAWGAFRHNGDGGTLQIQGKIYPEASASTALALQWMKAERHCRRPFRRHIEITPGNPYSS